MKVICIKPTLNWMKIGDSFTAEDRGDTVAIDANNGKKYVFEKHYFKKMFLVVDDETDLY